MIATSDLIAQAGILLQDVNHARWPVSELMAWLNEAQREIALLRPEVTAVVTTISAVDGVLQSLPSGAVKLFDVLRDVTNGTPMRLIGRDVLDLNVPDWATANHSGGLLHWFHDAQAPTVFWVYPRAQAGWLIEVVYSGTPAVATSALTIPDVFAGAVLDYMIYRAWLKDSESAQAAATAQVHYSAFLQRLQLSDKQVRPLADPVNVSFNPNTP